MKNIFYPMYIFAVIFAICAASWLVSVINYYSRILFPEEKLRKMREARKQKDAKIKEQEAELKELRREKERLSKELGEPREDRQPKKGFFKAKDEKELDELRSEVEKFREEAAKSRLELASAKSEISAQYAGEKEISGLKAEIEKRDQEIKKLKEAPHDETKNEGQAARAALGEKIRELASKDSEIKRMKAEIALISTKNKEAVAATGELSVRDNAINDLKAKLLDKDRELSRVNAEIGDTRKRMGEIEKGAQDELGKAKEELSKREHQLTAKDTEIKRLIEETVRLKDDLGVKARKSVEKENEIEKLRRENAEAHEKMKVVLSSAGEAETKDKEIARQREELEKIGRKMAVKEEEAAKVWGDLAAKEEKLRGAASELTDARERVKDLEKRAREEATRVTSEIEGLTRQIAAKEAEIKALNKELAETKASAGKGAGSQEEIEKLAAELGTARGRIIELEKTKWPVADISAVGAGVTEIEKILDDEKNEMHSMKMRLTEYKMKLHLLNEKTRENVELIAAFAKGKDFDEFRRSVHMDETAREYEETIKSLKMKNIELEKKLAKAE